MNDDVVNVNIKIDIFEDKKLMLMIFIMYIINIKLTYYQSKSCEIHMTYCDISP